MVREYKNTFFFPVRHAFFHTYTYIHIQRIAGYNLVKWSWERISARGRSLLPIYDAQTNRGNGETVERVNHSWKLPRMDAKLFFEFIRIPSADGTNIKINVQKRVKEGGAEERSGRADLPTSTIKFFETYRDRNYRSPARNWESTVKVARIAQRP